MVTGFQFCSPLSQPGGGPRSDNVLEQIMHKSPRLDSILSRKDEYRIQVIYTVIDRDNKNQPSFTDYFFNVNEDRYYYPASTVKLPVAILALQRLNELNIPGLDRNTAMITEAEGEGQTRVDADSSAPNQLPSIAHYIRKILLVSDNDAFNRLYEFLGQEYINDKLHEMGYANIEIIHRLSINMTEQQNRHTNPVRFVDDNGKTVYKQPARVSKLKFVAREAKDYQMGRGYVKDGQVINQPFDFSLKNRLPLASLHQIIRSIIFPGSVKASQRFNLTDDDYHFLRKHMSMMPSESQWPKYPAGEYNDNYVKMIYYGTEKLSPDPAIRIFNKTGDAYGFLTDAVYFVDFDNKIEFMLSANIYCNSDGIFNDDTYDYQTLGFPFLKELGRAVYQYERQRNRSRTPDLSAFRFVY